MADVPIIDLNATFIARDELKDVDDLSLIDSVYALFVSDGNTLIPFDEAPFQNFQITRTKVNSFLTWTFAFRANLYSQNASVTTGIGANNPNTFITVYY
jgi:hypothetical protein